MLHASGYVLESPPADYMWMQSSPAWLGVPLSCLKGRSLQRIYLPLHLLVWHAGQWMFPVHPVMN